MAQRLAFSKTMAPRNVLSQDRCTRSDLTCFTTPADKLATVSPSARGATLHQTNAMATDAGDNVRPHEMLDDTATPGPAPRLSIKLSPWRAHARWEERWRRAVQRSERGVPRENFGPAQGSPQLLAESASSRALLVINQRHDRQMKRNIAGLH